MLVVIALGGNALLRKKDSGHPEEQWRNVSLAAEQLAEIAREGISLVITHGNGPQVGYLLEAFESLPASKPRQSLDIAVAMTQGWIGYLLQHSLSKYLAKLRVRRDVVSIVTRVVVDKNDPAFTNPTKFVGSYYSREEAERLSREKGWIMRPDPRGGWRRVVPSPRPIDIVEKNVIRSLALNGVITVAVGGGGIPVDKDLTPVEAVIDKDLASSLLARLIDADRFVILTDVPGIAIDYGKPTQRWLREISKDELKELYEKGLFPPGSMGPKVKAIIEYVEHTGNTAVIGALEEASRVYRLESGTIIYP
ncbi:MAG: carbamate kinase [Desulfurococcales archaeon]|nr:carbamate kinase [Desulfurococcales archaeon]